jgi:hypothetical protein
MPIRCLLALSLAVSTTGYLHTSIHRNHAQGRKASYPRRHNNIHHPLFMSSDPLGPPLLKPKTIKKKNLKTFSRYLEVECWREAQLRSLEPVLLAVADASKQIARIVARAMTDDIYGVALGKDGLPLDENVQGEVQQKLDVLCNTIMLRAFCGSSRSINSVASEEEDEPRCCSDVMVCIAKYQE